MSPDHASHFVSARDQKAQAKACNDVATYLRLLKTYFDDSTQWENTVSNYCNPERRKLDEDYFRLLGLMSLLFAQCGFPSHDGSLDRHSWNSWKSPASSPRHVLASASYAGHVNTRALPGRNSLYREIRNWNGINGGARYVYGLMFFVRSGQVRSPGVDMTVSEIEWRRMSNCPVCLPTPGLNKRLAELRFEGHAAERMPRAEYERDVIPAAIAAIEPFMPISEEAFVSKEPEFPHTHVSLPQRATPLGRLVDRVRASKSKIT